MKYIVSEWQPRWVQVSAIVEAESPDDAVEAYDARDIVEECPDIIEDFIEGISGGRDSYGVSVNPAPESDTKLTPLEACKRVLRAIEWSRTEDRLESGEMADILRDAIHEVEA